MKLISSFGHSECDGHTVHQLSQRRLTADWLAPRESYCSRVYSRISSDWVPRYIEATRPVLEIFKMVGYFKDSPRKFPGRQNLVQEYESHLANPKMDASGPYET